MSWFQEKHVKSVSDQGQRIYEHIKEKAEEPGRYGGRAKEGLEFSHWVPMPDG